MPSIRFRALAAAVLVSTLLAPAAIGAVSASPAPIPVCGPCGRPFAYAAETHGVDLAIAGSEATVRVHENGTATWTVRNRLADERTVDRLRGNASLVDRIAAETLGLRGIEVHGHVLLGTSISPEGVVTMRYRTPGFAARTNGVLRVEYFRDDPGVYVYTGLGADRLTVIGPEGTVVTSGLRGATVEGRRLTVTSFESPGDGPFVVFAPAGDPLREARTVLAIASAVGPYVLRNLLLFVLLPAGVLAGLLGGVVRGLDRVEGSIDRARRYGAVVAGLGVLLALHPWYADPAPLIGGYEPTLLIGGIAAAAVGVVAGAYPDRLTLPGQFGAVGVGLALGALAALVAPGVVPGGDLPDSLVLAAGLAVPALLSFPVGYVAVHETGGVRRLVLSLQPIGVALGVVYRFPITSAGDQHLLLVTWILLAYAVGVVAFGVPLFVLGAALPGGDGRVSGT